MIILNNKDNINLSKTIQYNTNNSNIDMQKNRLNTNSAKKMILKKSSGNESLSDKSIIDIIQ